MKEVRPQHLAVFALVFAAAIGAGDMVRLRALDHYMATQTYEDLYYVPPPEWLGVMSVGHREALAGLLWCKALVYFGEEIVHRGDVEHVYHYVEAILTLDPDFRRVYRWASTAGIYRPQGVGLDEVRRAADYSERGARRFPDDGELAWEAGATLEFELVPLLKAGEEKDQAHARALGYLATAARLGKGPPWLALTNAASLTKLGKSEQAVRHLEEMYATVQDPATREEIRRRIEGLRSVAYTEALERTLEETERFRQRDFPYVDMALYLVMGRRPPVDRAPFLKNRFVVDTEVENAYD